ncbi:hypothetical protein [Desulforhabdus amnigena]|jgi:hypothetical protein|uniref:Uncharacterized protein n=1 Tax=Desulforhabdus amnigena TaxID=40218 RepID=A0A9W6D1Z0_9BACT|nr:hypothetical protein [Desulforhabdus amnigena]NLJ26862.1 hypothetical protein [Deltaproteobacteria bacterium]GLI33778.1 hypothetical protein DAMNIGENAA_12110 [Desulforhabdus amnigena]
MKSKDTSPMVWAKDKTGHRYLCEAGSLSDVNTVYEDEKGFCIDDDSRLGSRNRVPGDGKIRFAESVSLN